MNIAQSAKKLYHKLLNNAQDKTSLEEGATRFSCASQFGELHFWDTQKPHKTYKPESILSNETADMAGEPYDFRDLTVNAGDVIFDIGAHVGTVTIYLAKMFPQATIYAFEPMPSNFECLQKNIVENNVDNVIAVQSAVTKDGRDLAFTFRLALGQSQTAHMSSSEIHKKKDSQHELVQLDVKSVNLDDFMAEHNISAINLLKIDCEGAEYEVLYNFKHLNTIQHIRGELHSSTQENDALVDFLKNHSNLNTIRFTRNMEGEKQLSGFVYYPVTE